MTSLGFIGSSLFFISGVLIASVKNDSCELSLQRFGVYRSNAIKKNLEGTGIEIELRYFFESHDLAGAEEFVAKLKDIFERHPYLKNKNAFRRIWVGKKNSFGDGVVFINPKSSLKSIENYLVDLSLNRVWAKEQRNYQFGLSLSESFKSNFNLMVSFDKECFLDEKFSQNIQRVMDLLSNHFKTNPAFLAQLQEITSNLYFGKETKSIEDVPYNWFHEISNWKVSAFISSDGLQKFLKDEQDAFIRVKEYRHYIDLHNLVKKTFKEETGIELYFHDNFTSKHLKKNESIIQKIKKLYLEEPELFRGIRKIAVGKDTKIDDKGKIWINPYTEWGLRHFLLRQQKILKKRETEKEERKVSESVESTSTNPSSNEEEEEKSTNNSKAIQGLSLLQKQFRDGDED